MSVTLDATGIGQLAMRLGLVADDQVAECLAELDNPKGPAEDLIRALERKRYLSSFQGNKLRKGDLDGYFLGGYRLLYKIASGSFGRIYRGDDPRTGQVVAIKVLRNKWTMDKQKIDLFLREGKLGMTIRHPNIVSVLAVNQDSKTGQYFIVMEFVEGGNLRDLLQIRKKLAPDEAMRYVEECSQGLAYSHHRGLTHRDIKPTNILIAASNGQAKLVDFGLAEISTGSSAHQQRQEDHDEDVTVDRTVDYAGLERATNQKPGDVRSDIYFLGCVLYECITGETLMPVTKDRHTRMQARRYEEVEATLRKNGPTLGLSPPLITLLDKMVAFDPTERFQNPTQLVEAIQACRLELDRANSAAAGRVAPGPKTIYAVEVNEKLKGAFRKLNQKGFRVLLSNDPEMAIKQYQVKPFHILIVDAGSVGREAIAAFNRVVKEADAVGLDLAAVLLLSDKQADWAADAIAHDQAAVVFLPLNMKQLLKKIRELTPGAEQEEELQE